MDFLPPLVVELIADLRKFTAGMEGAAAEVQASESRLASMGVMGKAAIAGLGVAAVGVGAAAVHMASQFDAAMERVHTQAGASQAEVNKLKGAILALAPATGSSPEQLALSLYHVESAGFRGAQALSMVKAAAQGAAVGNANLESVTQAMIASMASGIKGVHGAADAMALLNTTVGVGDMKMEQLSRAMATGILPSARSAGLGFNDVAAALATITDNATPADEAATRLRMTFALMSAPTSRAVTALATIGMTSTQLATDMRQPNGLLQAVEDLKAHLEASGKTAVEQNAVIEHAFGGGRTSGAILTLLGETDRLKLKYEELGTAGQRAAQFQDAWASTQDQFSQKVRQAAAQVEAWAIEVGNVLIPILERAAIIVLDVAGAVGSAIGFFERHKVLVGALAGVLMAQLIPALARTATAMLAVASEAAVGGMWKMANAAAGLIMALNPVTLTLMAVGAAAAYAWQKNQAETAKAKQAVDAYVQSLNMTHDSIGSMTQGLDAIKQKFASVAEANGFPKGTFDIENFIAVSGKANNTLKDLQAQYRETAATSATLRTNEQALGVAYGMSTAQVEALAAAHNIDLTGALTLVDTKFHDVIAAAQLTHNPMSQAKADIAAMGASSTSASDAVKALKDALDELAGKAISADEAAITFRNNIAQLHDALVKSHGSLSLNSQAGRDARQSFDTAAKSALDLASSLKDAHHSNDQVRASLAASIATLKATAGNSEAAKSAIRDLQSAYDAIPASAAKGSAAALAGGKQIGHNLAAGLAAAIKAGEGAVGVASAAIIDHALAVMKIHAKIESPSKETALVGQMLDLGLAVGMLDNLDAVTAAAKSVVDSVLATIATAVDPRTGSLPDLLGGYAGARGNAIGAGQSAGIAAAHYQDMEEHAKALQANLDSLRAADYKAEQAARAHATALSNLAHEATKNKKALEEAARAASQEATALVAADKTKEAALRKTVDAANAAANAARQTAQAAEQAAQAAASAAAQAAKDLVAAVQAEANQLTQAISTFTASVSQGIAGKIDLSSLWGGQNGADGTLADLQANLAAQLAAAKKFRADLDALAAAGGSQDVILQLAGMGAGPGDSLTNQLLAGGSDAIKSVSDTMAQITAVGDQGAQDLANTFYGPGVTALDQFIAGLESKFPELDEALNAIAGQVNATLGTNLGNSAYNSAAALAGSGLTGGSGAGYGQAAGGTTVNYYQIDVHNAGSVISQSDLVDGIHAGLLQKQKSTPLGITS